MIVSEEDVKNFDLKYKMGAKNKPFICVTSCFDRAGFKMT